MSNSEVGRFCLFIFLHIYHQVDKKKTKTAYSVKTNIHHSSQSKPFQSQSPKRIYSPPKHLNETRSATAMENKAPTNTTSPEDSFASFEKFMEEDWGCNLVSTPGIDNVLFEKAEGKAIEYLKETAVPPSSAPAPAEVASSSAPAPVEVAPSSASAVTPSPAPAMTVAPAAAQTATSNQRKRKRGDSSSSPSSSSSSSSSAPAEVASSSAPAPVEVPPSSASAVIPSPAPAMTVAPAAAQTATSNQRKRKRGDSSSSSYPSSSSSSARPQKQQRVVSVRDCHPDGCSDSEAEEFVFVDTINNVDEGDSTLSMGSVEPEPEQEPEPEPEQEPEPEPEQEPGMEPGIEQEPEPESAPASSSSKSRLTIKDKILNVLIAEKPKRMTCREIMVAMQDRPKTRTPERTINTACQRLFRAQIISRDIETKPYKYFV